MQQIKKLWVPLLCLLALLLCVPAAFAEEVSIVDSGTCGENLAWALDSEGVLTISGTGNTVQSPWSDYRDSIKIVKIEHGVTVIGAGLFSNYTNLTRVTIPNSVFAIAGSAFSGCTSLKSVAIPASVSNIGPAAFDGCSSLTSVELSTGLSSIVNGVFSGCTSLTDVYFTGTQEEWDNINIMVDNEPLTNATLHLSTAVGTCGSNLTWTLDSKGTLTISGEGAMDDYHDPTAITTPWRDYRTSIKSVVLEEGVTHVGEWAFYVGINLTSVTLPNSLTSIGGNAFHSCSGLTDVTIPENVTSIGGSAFAYCSSLTGITIPKNTTSLGGMLFGYCDSLTSLTVSEKNPVYHSAGNCIIETASKTLFQGCSTSAIPSDGSVTSIGDSAFAGCSSLTSMTIPDGVTSIDKYAFADCSSLTSVTIPDSVTDIGKFAFSDDSNLSSVIIPESVTNIGEGAFNRCSGLTSLSVASGNPVYHSHGNCIIETASKTLLLGCSTSVIPTDGSVTSIGYGAFAGCRNLGGMTLPDSITSIADYAFIACSNLTRVSIPKSVTSIGNRAFTHCSNLTDVYFGGTQEEWNKITIGEENDYLTGAELHVASSVVSGTCGENLTWTLDENGLLTIFGEGKMANYECTPVYLNGPWLPSPWYDSRTSIKAVQIDSGVTSIGSYAFYECSSLTNITIPNSVTSIGGDAFTSCCGLTSLNVVNGNAVYHSAGNCIIETASKTLELGCSTSVIPSDGSVTSIGWDAFSGCSNLTNITIPDSVTRIGGSAFSGCSSLTSITIPESVTSIASHVFDGCSSLTSLTVANGNSVYHSAGNCLIKTASKTLTAGCSTSVIPTDGSVTSIGDSAFYGCSSLTSITIPNSVTSIGDFAFVGCSSLTSITIPESVTSISHRMFAYCSNLTEVTIPDGVSLISEEAFLNCSSLTSVTIPESVTSIPWCAFCGCSSLVNLTIPQCVTYIGGCAFAGCSSLTTVSIPSSVTDIDIEAFSYCTSLTDVYFNGTQEEWNSIDIEEANQCLTSAKIHFIIDSGICGENLTWMLDDEGTLIVSGAGEMANYHEPTGILTPWYDNRDSIKTVVLDKGVTHIGEWAFAECQNLTSIEISGSVTSIGSYAFFVCKHLTGVEIPEGVISIGGFAFSGCDSLRSVVIADSVISIGCSAFSSTKITSVVLPKNLTSIQSHTFLSCSDLTSVTIPASVTSIDEYAFFGCTSLTDIYFGGTQEAWEQITLGANNEQLSAAQVHYQKCVRISGSNRYATAIAVANELKKTWEVEKFDAIILASGQEFADALAGSYLATVKNAPILLSYGGGGKYAYLDTDNIDYIKNNLVSDGIVYILGGTSAVPNSYDTALESSGLTVMRLAGKNRFETNLAILTEAGVPAGSEVLVCNGNNFADSLSASATGKPILLVWNERGSLYGKQAVFLNSLQECTFTIIGGQSAVSSDFENILDSYGTVTRVAGKNRLDTSVKVAEKYFQKPTSAVLAYAWDFPDGLCGGVLAHAMGAPLILTASGLETQAAEYVEKWGLDSGIALGGTKALTDSSILKIYR